MPRSRCRHWVELRRQDDVRAEIGTAAAKPVRLASATISGTTRIVATATLACPAIQLDELYFGPSWNLSALRANCAYPAAEWVELRNSGDVTAFLHGVRNALVR
jgi:hypothetical protein